jgi:hypothetical protein
MKTLHETKDQLTCERIIPTVDIIAAIFYARIVEIDPELSFRFTDNLFERIRRLLTEPQKEHP